MALMPKVVIEKRTVGEIQSEFGYLRELIEIRKYIIDNEKE